MKIGILTFHNAHNYGAILQAYALRTKLRNLGYDTHIVNYRNEKIEKSYERKLVPKKVQVSLFHPRTFLFNHQKQLEVKTAQPSWEKRCEVFRKFIDKVILEDNIEVIDKRELKNLGYDAFICGSDQIWTDYLTGGLDNVYFLDFGVKVKKISYAASKVNATFSEEDKAFFKEKLRNFTALSVREETLAKALTDICQKEVKTVLDPALLLEKKDYEKIEAPIIENGEYVLAYFLVEDETLMQCAKWAADKLGMKLLEIHYYKQRLKNHNQIADCDPGEFLSYIKRAKYIFTNSFHGTVFSIIYQKNFFAVYDKDARKDNLLELLELENRHIKSLDELFALDDVEYTKANKLLREESMKSESFLVKALNS